MRSKSTYCTTFGEGYTNLDPLVLYPELLEHIHRLFQSQLGIATLILQLIVKSLQIVNAL